MTSPSAAEVRGLRRTLASYEACKANPIASGSKAQMMYFIEDAKADIATLATALEGSQAEVERLTRALKPFADTFRQHNDPGVSDLYNEQPVAWHVPLGAYRVAATLSPAVKEPE